MEKMFGGIPKRGIKNKGGSDPSPNCEPSLIENSVSLFSDPISQLKRSGGAISLSPGDPVSSSYLQGMQLVLNGSGVDGAYSDIATQTHPNESANAIAIPIQVRLWLLLKTFLFSLFSLLTCNRRVLVLDLWLMIGKLFFLLFFLACDWNYMFQYTSQQMKWYLYVVK